LKRKGGQRGGEKKEKVWYRDTEEESTYIGSETRGGGSTYKWNYMLGALLIYWDSSGESEIKGHPYPKRVDVVRSPGGQKLIAGRTFKESS